MSGSRAMAFAGKGRKTTPESRAKARMKEDQAGFKKAFGNLKGYGSQLKDFM